MPSKHEQGAKILAEGLGIDLSDPPTQAPTQAPMQQPIEQAPAAETIEHEETGEDAGVATLADLAAHLEVDITDLYDVQVNMGNEEPTTVGKLKDAERRARQLEKQLRGLETEREQDQKQLEALRTQNTSPFGGMPAELDQARLNAYQWHNYVYQNQPFWDRLKEDDPAQYMAEFTRAQQTAAQAANQFQQGFAAWQAQEKALLSDFRKQQRRKLAEADAAWADDTTRAERYKVISDWLRNGNANVPDNLSDVLTDPGMVNTLYEAAAAAQNLKTAKEGAPRKVGTAKLRRGALRSGSVSGGKLVDLIKHAKQTGKQTDKRAAGEAILTQAFQKAQKQ